MPPPLLRVFSQICSVVDCKDCCFSPQLLGSSGGGSEEALGPMSSRMDLDALLAAFRDLGTASKVTSKAEAVLCQQLAECLKQFLRAETADFICSHKSAALLYSYSFDTTRTMLAHTTRQRTSAGTIHRAGRQPVEMLMQRILVRGPETADQQQMRHLFLEPVPMSEGHSQWYVFAAACAALPLARKLGHQGFLVYHVVADRAQLSSVARLLQARQEAWHHAQIQADQGSGLQSSLPYLRDLFLSCGCALHDIQNGLRWSVHPLLKGEILKDCHIVLEALRNSTTTLMSCLPEHLAARCTQRDVAVMDESACRQLWSLLGVDATMLDLMVRVDPWYSGNCLEVNPGSIEERGADPFSPCSQCALYLMKWRRFNEARFLSMGTAAQGLLGSLAVGLSALVEDARTLPGTSLYHLNGFNRLHREQKQLLVVLTVVSGLAHELLSLVMSDDRLLRQLPDVEQIIEEEVALAHSWPLVLWQRLASLIDPLEDGLHLRSQALDALHIQASYVHEKIIRVMKTYPWKLGLDAEEDPLLELSRLQDEPQDQFTFKIWMLLRSGVSVHQLQDIPALLQQTSWSSMAVEQAHGSSATMRRFHPELTLDQHLARSFLHQCRHLFTPTAEQQSQAALEKRLLRLQNRRASVTGRNLFFKDLVAQTRQRLGGATLSREALQQLMSRHVSFYTALSPEEQHEYERQAVAASNAKRSALLSDVEQEWANQRLQKARKLEYLKTTGGVSNAVQFAKLAEEAAVRLHQVYSQQDVSQQNLRALRSGACSSPQPPPANVQSHFENIMDSLSVKTRTDPAMWVKQICEHRESFIGLTIAASLEEQSTAYRMCYAVQNPRLIVFQKMHVVQVQPAGRFQFQNTPLADLADTTPRHLFQIVPGQYCSSQDLPFNDEDDLVAVTDTFFNRAFEVASFALTVDLHTLLANYPHKHRHSQQSETRTRRTARTSFSEEEVAAHPWLASLGSHSSRGHSSVVSAASSSQAASSDNPQVLELDEVEIQNAWEELRAARESWSSNLRPMGQDFTISLRGGAWTKQHRGVAADAVMATAASEDGKTFLATYGEAKSASYSILAYENGATLLALEWCARRQHYLNCWVGRGRGRQTFTADDKQAYLPSPEWEAFFQSLAPEHAAFHRAQVLAAYEPRLAEGSSASSQALP